MDNRFNEERHEAQLHAVFFFEFVLVLRTQFHHRCHVDFVERREDGGGRLRLQQTLGDACAQARHGDALLGAVASGQLNRRSDWFTSLSPGLRRGDSRLATGALIDNIFFRHAATSPGASDVCGVDILFCGDLCSSGTGGGTDRYGTCLHGHRYGDQNGCSNRALRFRIEHRDDLTRGDRRAIAPDDLDDHAIGGRGQLHHHLVGFDVNQVFVALDRVAFLLMPCNQRGFRNGFRECRHFDFDLHFLSFDLICSNLRPCPVQREGWRGCALR